MQPEELLLGATLEELGITDELDGFTELLLEATLDELGATDELDSTTELLLGATLEELGASGELLDDELNSLDRGGGGSISVVQENVRTTIPPIKRIFKIDNLTRLNFLINVS